jgi:hypothetical protein
MVLNIFNKVKEPTREPLVLCWFFHENCQFCEVFEIIGTDSSLIVISFSKKWNSWFFDFGIFKEPENFQRTVQHSKLNQSQLTLSSSSFMLIELFFKD